MKIRYFNLLSIDAVLVALAWQEVLTRTAHRSLQWQERALLGISVWIVYIGDHLLDSLRQNDTSFHEEQKFSNAAPRHYFTKKNRFPLMIAVVAALIVDLFLARQMPLSFLLAGSALGLMTFAYLLINTWLLAHNIWPRGREIVIAFIFAVGCGLTPLVSPQKPVTILLSIMALAFLGSINCILIARMERAVPLSLLAKNLIPRPRWIMLACILFFFISKQHGISPLGAAFSVSLFGLSWIPSAAKRFGYETASLATDGALLVGALIALL